MSHDYTIALAKLRRFALSVEEDVTVRVTDRDREWDRFEEPQEREFRAAVARCERGDVYLYRFAIAGKASRRKCRMLYVPRGKALAEGESPYSAKNAVEKAVGGSRTETFGKAEAELAGGTLAWATSNAAERRRDELRRRIARHERAAAKARKALGLKEKET